MRISMNADFYIMKNIGNGEFVPMSDQEIEDVSVGGYSFHIGNREVPFDWEAHEGGWDKEGFFSFTTGYGWFFNNFELDECYDEHYAEIGLKREDITATFLASAHHIEDFYINFVVNGKECECGYCRNNSSPEALYRLQLLKVNFVDIETGMVHDVNPAVLSAFNKGEKLVALDNVIESAAYRSNAVLVDKSGFESDKSQERY